MKEELIKVAYAIEDSLKMANISGRNISEN
jgi:hypothetical protein